MATLRFLGTSYFIPDLEHGNTHMLLECKKNKILIDCPGDIVQRLIKLDISPNNITELILTHFHPDHVGGVALLLVTMWLSQRTTPLTIYGNHHTIKSIIQLMENSGWQSWPNFFPVEFVTILKTADGISPVIETEELRITSTFVDHFLPTNALRFDFLKYNYSISYSSDTEPSQEFVKLSKNVDAVIHEAAGTGEGHSSGMEAAGIANQIGAKELYLIHYQVRDEALENMKSEVQAIFTGQVHVAQDFDIIKIDKACS